MFPLFEFFGLHCLLPRGIHHSFRRTSLKDIHVFWNSRCSYATRKYVYIFKKYRFYCSK